mgnify:CR=1 FL=1
MFSTLRPSISMLIFGVPDNNGCSKGSVPALSGARPVLGILVRTALPPRDDLQPLRSDRLLPLPSHRSPDRGMESPSLVVRMRAKEEREPMTPRITTGDLLDQGDHFLGVALSNYL